MMNRRKSVFEFKQLMLIHNKSNQLKYIFHFFSLYMYLSCSIFFSVKITQYFKLWVPHVVSVLFIKKVFKNVKIILTQRVIEK